MTAIAAMTVTPRAPGGSDAEHVSTRAWRSVLADLATVWKGKRIDWGAQGVRLAQLSASDTDTSEMLVGEGCVIVIDGRLAESDGNGDAARILSLYRARGMDGLGIEGGRYAFALWDAQSERLLVGCDATGGRTVAYAWNGARFLMATRALSLLRAADSTRFDAQYIAHALCETWSQEVGATAFEGVRRLPPGTVLEVRGGRLSLHRIGILPRPGLAVLETRCPKEWSRAVAHGIDRIAHERGVRPPGAACLALSGGLDSMSLGASLAQRETPLDALSILSDRHPDIDESAPVAAFARRYPSVRMHKIPCDGGSLDDRVARVPFDDPRVVGAALLGARARLAQLARSLGHDVVIDGDGGDELFAMSPLFADLLHVRTLGFALRAGHTWPRLRAMTWRQAIVPRLPRPIRHAWHAREDRRRTRVDPWLTPGFLARAEVRDALEVQAESCLRTGFAERLGFFLARPASVGARVAHDVIAALEGVETTSPLIDGRIVALVIAAPPELRVTREGRKPLLRLAMQDRLPSEVLNLEKVVGFHDHVERVSLTRTGAAGRILDEIAGSTLLHGAVDLTVVERLLRLATVRGLVPPELLAHLASLYDFAVWSSRLTRDHDLRPPRGW